MHTVTVQGLHLAFADQDILLDINITIHETARIALAGANGSGKSTFMKVLAGLAEPDSGTVQHSRGTRVIYLPQSLELNGDHSIYEEVEQAYQRFQSLLEQQREIEHRLTTYDASNPPPAHLVETLDSLQQQLITSSYYDRERHIYAVLLGLGFTTADLTRGCQEFSGGWKMRIALAKVLLSEGDILLLDEPTNYLDLDARIWLTGFLRTYRGGVVVVSHDRQFLDDTVKEVLYLQSGSLTRYTGTFTAFEHFQREETEKLIQAHKQQQLEIQRIEQFIQRFRYKASKASQVQSRVTMLEHMQRIEIPPYLKRIAFSFPKPAHSGREVMHLRGIRKSYGSLEVISHLDLTIRRGERIALTGRNGAGKSTLIRIAAGIDQEYGGQRILGKDVSIGYFQQEIDEVLKGTHTVLQEIEHSAPRELLPSVRGYLGGFLFHDDDVFKPLHVLSGGEKSRVQLLKLLMQPHNCLILDEPTNHLDIMSKEILLDALKSYDGTLIFVSHDQEFIRELSDKILYFSQEAPRLFEGDYDYFLWKISSHQEEESSSSNDASPSRKPQRSNGDHEEQKRARNRLRSLYQEEQGLIHRLESLEEDVKQVHIDMALPEHYEDGDAIRLLQTREQELEEEQHQLMERWGDITEEIAQCSQEVP